MRLMCMMLHVTFTSCEHFDDSLKSETLQEPQMTPHESFLRFSLQQFPWIEMRWGLSTRINCNFVSFTKKHKETRFDSRTTLRFQLKKILIKTREINWNSSKAFSACRDCFCVHFSPFKWLLQTQTSRFFLQLFRSCRILRKFCKFCVNWSQKSNAKFVPTSVRPTAKAPTVPESK